MTNLGTFAAPLLVCGGAYGNLQALEALAAFQSEAGVPDSHVIHTGDAVAYCADTEAATQFIASRGWHAIKGNVEEQIASGAEDCGCGFEEGSACDVASARWYAHAVATLSTASKAWMAGLPSQLTFRMSGLRVWVSVLSPTDGGIAITHQALTFDAATAAAAIRRDGLPAGYADGLETGLWPSLDILPNVERIATGKPLGLDGTAFTFTRQAIAAE